MVRTSLWLVDWEWNGARIRLYPGSYVRNDHHYLKQGWTYSFMARGSIGVRKYGGETIFSCGASSGIVGMPDELAPVVNCRFSSFIVRSLNPKIQLNESYVSRIPIPDEIHDTCLGVVSACIALKTWLVGREITERSFDESISPFDDRYRVESTLHAFEGISEKAVLSRYRLGEVGLQAVLDETGTPAGWHTLIAGYDGIPLLPDGPPLVPLDGFAGHQRRMLAPSALADLRRRLRTLYEAGPGSTGEDDEDPVAEEEDDEDGEIAIVGARIPIPTETFVEELLSSWRSTRSPFIGYSRRAVRPRAGVACRRKRGNVLIASQWRSFACSATAGPN